MLNSLFYHSLIKKYITVFGNMFNDIYIKRTDSSGKVLDSFLVPIQYGPKEKWLAVFNKPLDQIKTGVKLPIISFQISSLRYDRERQTSNQDRVTNITDPHKLMYSAYKEVPYKITFDLFIMTKYSNDMAQIFEQIVPFFTPDFTNSAFLIPELGKSFDLPTRLVGINMEDSYTGEFTERRALIWTLSFEMDIIFIGSVTKQGVIKRIEIDAIASSEADTYPNVTNSHPSEHYTIMPGLTVDGQPTTKESESINYKNIEITDNYGYIEEWETFND